MKRGAIVRCPTIALGMDGECGVTTMDTRDFDSNDFMACEDEDKGPASLHDAPGATTDAELRPHSVSVSIRSPPHTRARRVRQSDAEPMQTRDGPRAPRCFAVARRARRRRSADGQHADSPRRLSAKIH